MAYACVQCGAETERGSLVGYADGTFVLVALCPEHRNLLRKSFEDEGVSVIDAKRPN